MQRLLEESVLFDISLEHYDLSYGDPWSNIQSNMNKIMLKSNSQQPQSVNIKPNLSSKIYKKYDQHHPNAKIFHQTQIPSTSSSKFTPSQQINLKKDQLFQQNQRTPQNIKDKNLSQKSDILDNNTSLMKLELLLLQKDQKMKRYSKRPNHNTLPGNKLVYDQIINHQPCRNKGANKQYVLKSIQKNQTHSKKNLSQYIQTRQILASKNQIFQFNLPKTRTNSSQLLQDSHTSGILFLTNQNSLNTNTKGSFQSLGNVLNASNQIIINPKRRSSIQKTPEKIIQPPKIKTVSISFKKDIKGHKNPLYIMGPVQQILQNSSIHPDNKSSHFSQEEYQKSLYPKTSKDNLHEKEGKQKKSISENSDSTLFKKPTSAYENDILELKKLLKDHQQKKRKIVIEKINLNNDLHLPLLKPKSQSLNFDTKKQFRTPKKKYSLAMISKKCTNLKFKSQTQRGNQFTLMKQNQKTKDIHLILKKDMKKTTTVLHSLDKNQKSKPISELQDEYSSKNSQRSIKRVTLTSVLNGKFKVDDLSSKKQSEHRGISKSCFFTNYKSVDYQKSIVRDKDEKYGKLHSKLNQRPKQRSKLISDSVKMSQNSKHYPQNLFKQKNHIRGHQIDSIHKIITMRNQIALLDAQNLSLKENSIEPKNSTKWQVNSMQCTDRKKRKTQFSLRKNLDAQKNISLFKLSLNCNKNKLVIIRR